MAATIRLMRFGKKKQPFYRIIVVDKRKKRDGRYIEEIGVYSPLANPAEIKIKKERFDYWREKGALFSEGLARLLRNKKKIEYVQVPSKKG